MSVMLENNCASIPGQTDYRNCTKVSRASLVNHSRLMRVFRAG